MSAAPRFTFLLLVPVILRPPTTVASSPSSVIAVPPDDLILPPVTVSPFCKSANPDDTKVFVANAPLAVISAPSIFENVTLSAAPSCKLFLASNSVPAPVPPDAMANGVDNVSIAVARVLVFAS